MLMTCGTSPVLVRTSLRCQNLLLDGTFLFVSSSSRWDDDQLLVAAW